MKNIFKNIFNILKKFRRIFSKEQKRQFGVLLILMIIGSFVEMLGVSIIVPFVQAIMIPEKLMENRYIQTLMMTFQLRTSESLMISLSAGIIILYFVKNIFLSYSSYRQVKFQCKVSQELSSYMLKSYMKRPYTFFINCNSSEVMRGVDSDVSQVYAMLAYGFKMLSESITTIVICCFILFTDIRMAITIILLSGMCLLGVTSGFRPLMKRAGEGQRKYTALRIKNLYEAFGGIKEIFVMQRKDFFVNNYSKAAAGYQESIKKGSYGSILPDKIIEAVCVSGLIGIVCIRIVSGTDAMSFIPQLASFAVAAFKILPSVAKITNNFNAFMYCKPSLDATDKNLQDVKEYEQREKEYNNQHFDNENHVENVTFQRKLIIDGISWKYPNADKYVLDDLNLQICKGRSVAFIGESGAGKTTLADVILGLLKPEKGRVLLDEINIFTIPANWSRIIGYVPQAVYLTDDTVRNNVAFGIDSNKISDDLVWNALAQAQLKGFVEKLPLGLDTIVGERGIKFSGGQKQRIAIARALYGQPEILVLDEATSALDGETEMAVMEAIEALQGKLTLIIVAHRLTTIRNCDEIYEIVNGKAVMKKKEDIL